MAKRIKLSVDWDSLHRQNIDRYSSLIDNIYNDLAREAALIGSMARNKSRPFKFSAYPELRRRADAMITEVFRNIEVIVSDASRKEWLLAASKNDEIVRQIFANESLSSIRMGHYYDRNLDAFNSFQKRKIGGIGISDRIWSLKGQAIQEIEMGIDIGLTEGRSAEQMGRDLRKYLKDPEQLFRRVKDERGALQLSKNAKAYHPGQGVYRSSRMNALRLTRTETNMAYRESDHERWQQLDFILGYEVKRSNNPYPCPICDALKGKYPKSFKFLGWHPTCRCFAVPILAKPEEFLEQMLLDDTTGHKFAGEVSELPKNFTKWLKENDRGMVPHFIKINAGAIKNLG